MTKGLILGDTSTGNGTYIRTKKMKLVNLFKQSINLPKQRQQAVAPLIKLIRQLYRTGNYAAMILVCDQTLAIDFTNSEVYLLRGLAKGNLGDRVGASQDIEQAATFDGQ